MSASLSHGLRAEPNLTPILDLVFQLITFFMLVMNFKSASMDMSLKLPVVGSARPIDTQGGEELLIMNIDSSGRLIVYGHRQDIEQYIANEAQASLRHAQKTNPNLRAGEELPTRVVIRADRATPFSLLNRVIRACQERGFRRFSLKTINPEAKP